MHRNLDLCRQILLTLEARDPGAHVFNAESFGVDEATVNCHIELLHEAGLLQAIITKTRGGVSAHPLRLTWQGHDFLDACREESTWQKAKTTLREKVGSAAFEIVVALLTDMAKKQLGL